MTNQQPQPPQPEAPEHISRLMCDRCGRSDSVGYLKERHFFRTALCTGKLIEVTYIRADLAAASTKAAREDEREQIIKILADYEDQCGETAKRFADLTDDPTDERMYWRADGAADSMEHLIAAIRSRSEHVGE